MFFLPRQAPLLRAVYALIVLALAISLGVELVVLDGDIGRQNTPGSRLPLMRALLLRGRWPVACRRWFAGVWPEEVRRGGAEFERELAATGLSNLGGWILEERDEDLKRDLSRIHARLSAHGSR